MPEFRQRQSSVEAGNRFQLVQRAASVAQATARNHGHEQATRRGNRSDNQRSLVAYSAGGMLVNLGLRELGEIKHAARPNHRFSQIGSLPEVKTAEKDCHQES